MKVLRLQESLLHRFRLRENWMTKQGLVFFACNYRNFWNLMTEPNRIRQAVATTVFASVLALGAYQGRIIPDAEQLTETVHMTCEKEKKDKNIVTASNISEPDQSKHDIEYEELNGSLQTVVYARQQVTLTKEHRIPAKYPSGLLKVLPALGYSKGCFSTRFSFNSSILARICS